MSRYKSNISNVDSTTTNLFENNITKSVISKEVMGHVMGRLNDIYKNQIEAIVRETFSNAYDAVKEAGYGEIRISKPTSIYPFYSIQDTGIGMPLEVAERVFINYGESTKRGNLNQIGEHGLGTKSPLAYTNEYHVETIHDGVKVSFSMISTNGEIGATPRIVEDTTEANGTKITIPVDNPEDFQDFALQIKKNTSYCFSIPVYVNGELLVSAYEEVGSIILDKEENLVGRVFVTKETMLPTVFSFFIQNMKRLPVSYALGGSGYSSNNKDVFSDSEIVIEIVPGLIDFNSNRDQIKINERSASFNDFIYDQLFESKENIIETAVEKTDEISMHSALTIASKCAKFENGFIYKSEEIDESSVSLDTRKIKIEGSSFSMYDFLEVIYNTDAVVFSCTKNIVEKSNDLSNVSYPGASFARDMHERMGKGVLKEIMKDLFDYYNLINILPIQKKDIPQLREFVTGRAIFKESYYESSIAAVLCRNERDMIILGDLAKLGRGSKFIGITSAIEKIRKTKLQNKIEKGGGSFSIKAEKVTVKVRDEDAKFDSSNFTVVVDSREYAYEDMNKSFIVFTSPNDNSYTVVIRDMIEKDKLKNGDEVYFIMKPSVLCISNLDESKIRVSADYKPTSKKAQSIVDSNDIVRHLTLSEKTVQEMSHYDLAMKITGTKVHLTKSEAVELLSDNLLQDRTEEEYLILGNMFRHIEYRYDLYSLYHDSPVEVKTVVDKIDNISSEILQIVKYGNTKNVIMLKVIRDQKAIAMNVDSLTDDEISLSESAISAFKLIENELEEKVQSKVNSLIIQAVNEIKTLER